MVKLGELFQNLKREHDVVARWGGEEFLIVLPEKELDHSKLLAENFRSKIEELKLSHNGNDIPATMSFGVSEFGQDSDSLDECLKISDENLYKAKESGRNTVIG